MINIQIMFQRFFGDLYGTGQQGPAAAGRPNEQAGSAAGSAARPKARAAADAAARSEARPGREQELNSREPRHCAGFSFFGSRGPIARVHRGVQTMSSTDIDESFDYG